MLDVDLAEDLGLVHLDHPALEELEHGEEGGDDGLGAILAIEELGEAHAPACPHLAVHRCDGEADGDAVRRDVLGLEQQALTAAVDIGADDREAPQGDAVEVVGHEVQELGVGTSRARDHAALGLHARRERGAHVPELLVGDEAGDEDLARLLGREGREVVLIVELVARGARGTVGDERGGLDVEQRRCDEHEIARDIEVEVAHALDLREVLVGDLRDRDGADGDLLPAHEVEQQVEGARERRCGHAVRHGYHQKVSRS